MTVNEEAVADNGFLIFFLWKMCWQLPVENALHAGKRNIPDL